MITNQPPVAMAGPDRQEIERDIVFLDASDSTDNDGDITRYIWEQISGPDVTLNKSDTDQADFVVPTVNTPTAARFRVTVSDDSGASATDEVTLTLAPDPVDEAPRIRLNFDGRERIYTLYRPENFTAGSGLIMLLHGGNQSSELVVRPNRTTRRWVDVADREGIPLLIPNGFSTANASGLTNRQTWNDLREDTSGRTSLEDDRGFLIAALDDAAMRLAFDRDKVAVIGSSNGGIMAMTMLIEENDRFASGAAFISALPEEEIMRPASGTPLFMLNGTADPLILFEGGPVSNGGAPTRSVPDTINYWIDINGADPASRTDTPLEDRVPDDDCTITLSDWSAPGVIGPVFRFARVDGGGHSIPDPDPPIFDANTLALIGNICEERSGIDLAFDFLAPYLR